MILLLPVLLLLAGAALVGAFRRASSFSLWLMVLGSVFLGWLALLLGSGGRAGTLDVSVWRPERLFSAELVLQLGSAQWEVLYAAATLLIVLVLTAPARDGEERPSEWALFLVYSSLSLLAMMAGNLLTLSLLLIVLDITCFVFVLQRTGEGPGGQQAIVKLGVESVGVLLLLTAGLIGTLERGEGHFAGGETAALALMLALGVGLRIELEPLPLGLPPDSASRRSIGALMRLMPPAILLVQLGLQWPAGFVAAYQGWLIALGAVAAGSAGLAWAFAVRALDARAALVACAAGLGLLASGGVSQGLNAAMSAVAVLLLLAGGLASVAEVHTPFHRIWPAALAIASLGFPLTPAGAVLRPLGEGEANWLLGIAIGLGLGLLAAGLGQMTAIQETPWRRAEGYSRLLYGVGLALCPVAAVGFGLRQGLEISVPALLGLGASLVSASLAILVRRMRPEAGLLRARRFVGWLDASPLVRALWSLYGGLLAMARGVGTTLEGEGAFLWVMALVAFVAALLAGNSG